MRERVLWLLGKDAAALAEELRRNRFDVDVRENLTKDGMQRAIGEFTARIKPNSVALLFFSGYGIQAARQSYMIPVSAQIWSEAEVKRDGISIEAVLQRAAGAGENQTDLIILTHDCVEADMNHAMAQMQALGSVLAPIIRLRKEDLS